MDILSNIQKVVTDANISNYTDEFETLFPKLVELTNSNLVKRSAGQLALSTHGGSVEFAHLWSSASKILLGEPLGNTNSVKYELFTTNLYLSFTYVPNQDKVWYLKVKQGDVFAARSDIQAINTYMKQEIEKLKGK